MKFIAATLLAGGTLVSADLPNPQVGECVIADVVVTRSEPTMIDPDGEVLGLRIWQSCGYQYPNGTGGYAAKDDVFVTDVDLDIAELIAAAAGELVEG